MGGGTGRTRELTAWLERLPPELASEPCGIPKYTHGVEGLRPIPPEAWRATSTVFEDEDDEDTVELVLEPP